MTTKLTILAAVLAAFLYTLEISRHPADTSTPPVPGDRSLINPAGETVETRILPPPGYVRSTVGEGTFARYLRQLPIKPHGAPLRLFDGTVKPNNGLYVAVVDMDIGDKDLHHCADAVIRLRAEYLWRTKQYNKIHFNFTNGFRADYSEWMKGKRIVVKGNDAFWVDSAVPSNTYQDLWDYLEMVFTYAGTLSLSQELQPVSLSDMHIGDIFIQGGLPGHAAIVVDMAVNPERREKLFLLAQSFMPAQEIHLLENPADPKISPWYPASFEDSLLTPVRTFGKNDLKRFGE